MTGELSSRAAVERHAVTVREAWETGLTVLAGTAAGIEAHGLVRDENVCSRPPLGSRARLDDYTWMQTTQPAHGCSSYSLLTESSAEFVTQMLAPSNATPNGEPPT